MNKLAWLEAVARQFFHLINIAVVIDLINSYHFLSNETKLKLGFAYFKYVWDMLPERECLCRVLLSLFIESFLYHLTKIHFIISCFMKLRSEIINEYSANNECFLQSNHPIIDDM